MIAIPDRYRPYDDDDEEEFEGDPDVDEDSVACKRRAIPRSRSSWSGAP